MRGNIHLKVGSNVANVGNFNADNGLNVNDWNRDKGNDNVWAVRLVVSRRKIPFKWYFAWWSGSSHQASCLFLVGLIVILNIFYQLMRGYFLQVLTRFLEGLILC